MRLSLQHRYRSAAGLLLRMLVVVGLLFVSAPPVEAHADHPSGGGPFVAAVLSPVVPGHCAFGHGPAEQPGSPAHHCAPAHAAGCYALPVAYAGTFVARAASAWPETEAIAAGLALAPPLPPPIAPPGA
jgi:hypothetical protein